MNTSLQDLQGLSKAEHESPPTVVTAPPSRWKSRIALPGSIVVTIVVILAITSLEVLLPATPIRVVPVVVKTVEGAAGSVTVQAPGWLEPDPHPYYVSALAPGVVEEALVLEGDHVEVGQVVASLVAEDAELVLTRAVAEVARHESALLSAQAELTAAKLELEHLITRTRAFAVAQAGVAEAESELERVRADIAVERAKLAELKDEYDRKSQLTESQAVSEATVARLKLRLDAQEATLSAAIARESVDEAKLRIAQAEFDAETTNSRLLIDENRAVSLAEAAVGLAQALMAAAQATQAEAELCLDRMEVRSKVSGIVMTRLVSPGTKLTLEGDEYSMHVVHVYNPLELQARIDVPLADAAHVTVGQQVELIVEVLPDRTFTGRVSRIVHQADIQKNTVEVKVSLDEPSEELKPEMLARAKFLAQAATSDGSIRQRIFAPESLVAPGEGGGSVALVVSAVKSERGRVEQRAITTGTRKIDGWIEVISGLRVGDLLIAEPTTGLGPGDRVRIVGEEATGTGG